MKREPATAAWLMRMAESEDAPALANLPNRQAPPLARPDHACRAPASARWLMHMAELEDAPAPIILTLPWRHIQPEIVAAQVAPSLGQALARLRPAETLNCHLASRFVRLRFGIIPRCVQFEPGSERRPFLLQCRFAASPSGAAGIHATILLPGDTPHDDVFRWIGAACYALFTGVEGQLETGKSAVLVETPTPALLNASKVFSNRLYDELSRQKASPLLLAGGTRWRDCVGV